MRISDWSSDVCSSDLPHDEIDFEFLGKSPRQVQVNYYTARKGGHETMIDLGFDASEDFHTYAFEWRPDSIRWFVDGRQVHEETGQRGPLPSTPGKIDRKSTRLNSSH